MGLVPVSGVPDPNGADCVGCGRCCHHEPRTVHLLESDEERMMRSAEMGGPDLLAEYTILERRPPGFRFIKNEGARCGGLDVSKSGLFPCKIYEFRPDDCRIVEAGSPACLEARALGHLGKSIEFKRLRDEPFEQDGPHARAKRGCGPISSDEER